MKFKQIFLCCAVIFAFSFLLNFLWESLHAYSLYEGHIIDSDKYARMMIHMSFGDALVILVIYWIVSIFSKNIFWIIDMKKKEVVSFLVLGLFAAIIAEYWAVFIKNLWQYNDKMPVLSGIGLSPMVQLSVTGLMSIWIASRLLLKE